MRFRRTVGAAVAAVALAMGITGSASAAEDFNGRFTNLLAEPKPGFWLSLRDTHVPQGLSYWPGDGQGSRFFVTYYDPDTTANSRLAVHGNDGSYFKNLRIGGGHVGGVVAWRDWLYTVDTASSGATTLRKYRLADIGTTPSGTALPLRDSWTMPANSGAFVTIQDDKLFFGSHTKDKSYTEHGRLYTWPMSASSGNPTSTPTANFGIPGNVQGLVVTPNYFVFSQSWDRDCWSRITVRERGGGFASDRFIYAPAMSEGITAAAGSLYVNFESGASLYAATARNVIHRPWFGSLSAFTSEIQANGRTLSERSPDECDE